MEHWFTSDTHFCHANIIKYCNRPFKDIQEHDEMLIRNWNARVKQEDHVYHLGDFAFRNKAAAASIRNRLMGKIFFIQGNHDAAAREIKHMFSSYDKVSEIEIDGQGIFLSHYAHRVWNKSHHGVWHLYGHSHGTLPDDPNSLSFDVGVDCHGYKPISFAEVKAIMAQKSFKPVDHHTGAK